ncbi:Aste57867_17080 [Aphanomyces stellatus]|uniref:Aste57867_17080 protein n=1 Tax=Aphanomyces stellatus TaxID=120398 RepID=A0A485L721_9STRA|nr:hypothetical protein As57867_017022 [Aphanomyces stellatus]VFT93840.1 Aste57867_17080 [Aphanomyces stellatus]
MANATTTNASPTTLVPNDVAALLALQQYWAKVFQSLQIVYTVSYSVMFLLSLGLVVYLRRNRATAYRGDSDAARKAILPSFEPLFWVLCISTGTYTFYFLVAASLNYTDPIALPWFTELLYQGRQFIFFLLASFLLQKSVSRPALVRSIVIALVLAGIPIALVEVMDRIEVSELTETLVTTAYRTIFVVCYIRVAIWPISRASVRTQREYCAFVLLYYAFVYVYNYFYYVNNSAMGSIFVFIAVAWASVAPLFVWRILKADTEHWRGFSERACEFQQLFRENQGMQEIVSSQGLHVLLEMHRKDIIDFAHLELTAKIGLGASAHVYKGKLHSTIPVAVKVYSPTEITEATILDFSQEAALCAALKHPNIVQFFGMCICPPSICLVYELCRGSLEVALQKPPRDYFEPLWPKLCYMLDAARAVAHLHSFSPPFIHRDVKPANFLLDAANVVKLTDFGESRSMAVKVADVGNGDEHRMTMRGTVDYMAPEIIDGKQGQAAYTEKADIFSLAITLWDILHPGREKYPSSNRNHLNIFQTVLDGQRPPIDPEVPQTLHDLLENAWSVDAQYRPSAKMVVSTLEQLQEDLCGQIAHLLSNSVAMAPQPKKAKPATAAFTGEELVRCLLEHEYAFEMEEALRMGNALMDAGCLHHSKHSHPFDATPVSTFYFDTQQLDLNTPLVDKMNGHDGSIMGDSTAYATTSWLGDVAGLCACRKLGQGHVKPKMPRKKNLFGRRKGDQDVAMLTVNLLHETGGDADFVAFPTTSTNNTASRTLTMHALA